MYPPFFVVFLEHVLMRGFIERECLNYLERCKVKDSTIKTENIIYSQLIPSYKANIKRFKQYDQKV